MQFGRIEAGRDRLPATGEPYAAPTPAGALVADLIGRRKRVLDVGCGTGLLSRVLAGNECDIVGVDRDPLAIEEARRYCAHAFVADVETTPIAEIVGERTFEMVLMADVLDHLREPMRLLDDCRALLEDGGSVVATIANGTHGATRLALRSNAFADALDRARLRLFGAKGVEELFAQAGYRIERMERVIAPFDRTDATAAEIADLDADPESETLAFVVRATPLSNEAKYRGLSKRLLLVSSELAAANQAIVQRDRELAQLREERAPGGDRQRTLIDGLRRALDAAIAEHDKVAAEASALRRKLESMTENRDEHLALGQRAVAQFRETRDALAEARGERDDAVARLTTMTRDLERAASERDQAIASRDMAFGARDAATTARDAAAAALQAAVAERDEAIASRDAAAAARDAATAARDAAVATIAALEAAAAERDDAGRAALEEQIASYARGAEAQAARELGYLDTIASLEGEIAGLTGRIESLERRAAADAAEAIARDAEIGRLTRMSEELEAEVIAGWEAIERGDTAHDDLLAVLAEVGQRFEDEHERNEQLARDLQAQVLRSDEREAALVADVIAFREQAAERGAEVSRITATLKKNAEELAARTEQLDRRTAELAERTKETAALRDEIEVANSRLILQADAIADATRAEIQRIATLIDAVQSGPAWTLKRMVARALRLVRR